jgi:hypothetical protein
MKYSYLQLFAEGEVNIGQYLPTRNQCVKNVCKINWIQVKKSHGKRVRSNFKVEHFKPISARETQHSPV